MQSLGKKARRLFVGGALLSLTTTLVGATDAPPTAPDLWAQTVLSKSTAADMPWIQSLTIVEEPGAGSEPHFLPFSEGDAEKIGFFTVFSPVDAAYTVKINRLPVAPSEKNAALRNLFALLPVDAAIISKTGAKEWRLAVATAENGEGAPVQIVATAPAPSHGDAPADVRTWVEKALGYDGVILDVREDLILVMAAPEDMRMARQATVLAGSSELRVLGKTPPKASAIIEKVSVSADGSYAVFKRILGTARSAADLRPGGKILFQQK